MRLRRKLLKVGSVINCPIPAEIVREMELSPGQGVSIDINKGNVVVTPDKSHKKERK